MIISLLLPSEHMNNYLFMKLHHFPKNLVIWGNSEVQKEVLFILN